MSAYRILIVSDARPARAWKLAKRIRREIADAEICGVVQSTPRETGCFWKFNLPFQSLFTQLVHSALWWIHGCPSLTNSEECRVANSARECGEIACPTLYTDELNDSNVLNFVADQQPDLAISIGDNSLCGKLLAIPRCGWLRAVQRVVQDSLNNKPAIEIEIESLANGSECPVTIAKLNLPMQPFDGFTGRTLKTDLISDDLTVQCATHLLRTNLHHAANAAADWTQEIFSPYLEQLTWEEFASHEGSSNLERHRSTWKLFLDTLVLCSPMIVGRNWYRRLRHRYPVTILTHHLVSDRPHRMGISTECFLRQVRFLQRHYRIVSLTEAVELVKSGRVESPTAVITFDDGYADNFVSLRAVMEETGIPVTLFVATQQVEEQKEFQHDIENSIHGFFPLTWQQIRYWIAGRVEFEAHTRTHFDCGTTERSKLEYEIVGSRNDLERQIGMPVKFFAFPFGQQENMSKEAVEIVKSCYSSFVSGFGGENSCRREKSNQHLLRKNLYANAWEQELDLQSVFDLVDGIKQKLRHWRPRAYGAPRGLHPLLAGSAADTVLKQN